MALIQWQESYSVGIELLDDDHRLLISLINQLEEASQAEQDTAEALPTSVTNSVLTVLVEYTKGHFAREEAMMEKAAYPDLEGHRAEHQALAAEVETIAERYQQGDVVSLQADVLVFLKNWLMGHILGVDKLYAPYLKNVTLTPSEILASMGCDDMAEDTDALSV